MASVTASGQGSGPAVDGAERARTPSVAPSAAAQNASAVASVHSRCASAGSSQAIGMNR